MLNKDKKLTYFRIAVLLDLVCYNLKNNRSINRIKCEITRYITLIKMEISCKLNIEGKISRTYLC